MTFYRLFLLLMSPVIIFVTLRHFKQHRDSRYLVERFALYYPKHKDSIWIHCASVGEVITAEPLIKLLANKYGEESLLITTNTITGAEVVANRFPFYHHCYLPLDYSLGIRHFLFRVKPRIALIMETELWPNLFMRVHRKKIPLNIINARLTERTMKARPWLREVYEEIASNIDHVYCRSEQDKRHFISLGTDPLLTETIGNIKFSAEVKNLSEMPNPIGRPYVLAASTHDNEELQIAEAWNKASTGNLLLVIAPRHPERCRDIIIDLPQNRAQIAVRSRGEMIDDHTRIYIADTVGEMDLLMAHSEFVFMGGSLVEKGGHNILEPARAGKAVIYGPHMKNFATESKLFLENKAAIQVNDAEHLTNIFNCLIEKPEIKKKYAYNAKFMVAKNRGIAGKYADRIYKQLEHS